MAGIVQSYFSYENGHPVYFANSYSSFAFILEDGQEPEISHPDRNVIVLSRISSPQSDLKINALSLYILDDLSSAGKLAVTLEKRCVNFAATIRSEGSKQINAKEGYLECRDPTNRRNQIRDLLKSSVENQDSEATLLYLVLLLRFVKWETEGQNREIQQTEFFDYYRTSADFEAPE
jgi:hypothetical protein